MIFSCLKLPAWQEMLFCLCLIWQLLVYIWCPFFYPVFLIHDSAFLKCIHNTPECIFSLLMFRYHSPIILLWSFDWLYNKPSIHHSPPPPPLTHPFKFCSFCYPVLGVISVSVTETCNSVVIPFNSSLDIYIYCH